MKTFLNSKKNALQLLNYKLLANPKTKAKEMLTQLIKQLMSSKFPSLQTIETLRRIQQKLTSSKPSVSKQQISSQNLTSLLVSFSCQNKNCLHLQNFQEKHLSQKCLAYIEQIFFLLMKCVDGMKQKLTGDLVQHVVVHPSCFVSYLLLYKMNKRMNGELLPYMSYDWIKKINIKIIAHFQEVANEISTLHSLSKNSSFKKCEENLTQFLKTQQRPTYSTKNPEEKLRPSKTKIPPLLLPTSKSIGSSRFSYSNEETAKKKGLNDLVKLAESLGEGFVSVQLGILIGNKRTQQVNEFTQNSQYRQKYLEQIETERATSRISMLDGISSPNTFSTDLDEQKNQKNFINVLTINGNLLVQKLQKDDNQFEPFLRQYLDLGFTDIMKFACLKLGNQKIEFNEHQGQIKTVLYSLQKILSILMNKCAQKSEISHIGQLLNRNKQNLGYHYNAQRNETLVKDELLQDVQAIKQSNFKPAKGPLPQEDSSRGKHHYQDFVIQYIRHYLKEIVATWDMSKQQFYLYEAKLLKLLGFYLNETTSNTTKYLIVEKIFPLLILIKRQFMQLSHPYLNIDSLYQNQNSHKNPKSNFSQNDKKSNSLIYRFPQLFANYLIVISKLMTNNKHVEKLCSAIFLKNIYFIQMVQNFANFSFMGNFIHASLAVLEFFRTTLKIYNDRKNRNSESKTLAIIFQNISQLINSNQGCVARTVKRLQHLINPNNNSINPEDNEMHYFYQQILRFITEVYYFSDFDVSSQILQQETATFYIKFCMVNFVKLYSSLTVTELMNTHINSKEILATTKSSPHYNLGSNLNQEYMILFLRILSNISINRTNEISKKMRQYRILEFFVRELQLEFSVMDNIDKYIRKAKKTKDVPKKFYTQASEKKEPSVEKGSKKIKIPSLNLNGDSLKGNKEEPSYEQAKASTKPIMKIPTLKIPLKTEERQKTQNKSQKGMLLQLTKLNLGTNQSQRQGSIGARTSERNIIYYEQRKVRKIYSSKTLHAECILLVLSLVLHKGLLDPYYCDQFPITHGKTNILYILHYHLNHESNQNIIPLIGELVSKIKPYLSGQRLLKLLTNSFTDVSNYKNWKKINSGAYGVIYSCQTNISQPRQVAIKEMNFPKSIYQRCVLHDIFTEITCLQNFRLDDRITKMYNYGVVDNTYVIVMKRYNCSLRQWILNKKEILTSHVSTILTIYYDVLKIVKTLHQQKVTHYDIKADNILLEIDQNDENTIRAVFGDFGECKIYESQNEEFDMKSRGTECIKSPQMLTLALQSKKQADHYDRRKKIGTTRASDIWSLGCLFYQILTGQFLFHRADWVNFYVHVTSHNEQLLTQQNSQKLSNNTLLIQFLKFMLIRDPNHRPSITNLIDKYDHLYALLVNVPPNQDSNLLKSPLAFNQTLDNLVANYMKEISRKNYEPEEVANQNSVYSVSKRSVNRKPKASGYLMKIMNDIYYCDNESYFTANPQKFKKEGITHIISSQPNPHFLNVFVIKQLKKNDFYTTMSLAFKLCPRISDILREVLLVKGKLLFVNNETNYAVNLLIYTLSYWFRCSVYETWCLINTQILLFPALNTHLIKLSSSLEILNKIQNHVESLPKLQCICGSVTMILKKKITQKKGESRSCKCKTKPLFETTRDVQHSNDCSSLGCNSYLDFLKKRYSIYWQNIKWVETNESYFLTTLLKTESPNKDTKKQLIKDCLRTEIILNSAEPYENMINAGSSIKGWKVYQCKVCEMWMLSMSDQGNIWVVMNNLIRRSRQGIMIPNAQQDFKMRTPALNFYTLSKLHMTSQ